MSASQSSKARVKHSTAEAQWNAALFRSYAKHSITQAYQSYDIQSKKENTFGTFKKRWKIIYNRTPYVRIHRDDLRER